MVGEVVVDEDSVIVDVVVIVAGNRCRVCFLSVMMGRDDEVVLPWV